MRHTVNRSLPLLALAGIGWLVWSVSRREAHSPMALLPQPQPKGESGQKSAGHAASGARTGAAAGKAKPAPKPVKPAKPDAAAEGFEPVRAAGPSQMKDPPRDWDEVDEENDESFPASDPPGRY